MRRCIGAALALLGIAACGSPSPEEQLAALSQERNGAEAAVSEARKALADQEAVLEQARTGLEVRREELTEAEAGLAEIDTRLQAVASDPVVFRGVQRRLLEDPLFEGLAIRVEVERGVVVLHGNVPDSVTRDAALQAARRFPGVVSVMSRLAVDDEGPRGAPRPEPVPEEDAS